MSKDRFCLDWEQYAKAIRKMSAQGCVLLKNDRETLPIRQGEKVSVFGRIQLDYYNAGAGSGGMVNVPYVVTIPEGLRKSGVAVLNEELYNIYEEWEKEHPFDQGHGWATEPYYQEEMPLTAETVQKARENSDLAVVVIGRLAGEDRDVELTEGSYYLTRDEEDMLAMVTGSFDRCAVLFNVGAVMDMSWVAKYDPSAVMYIWQGGLEGGSAVADLLCGIENPSGRLADTIALGIEDYPAYGNYGDEKKNYYAEDIYVGYRYFETAAKDKVMYPFGYGLSYTSFTTDLSSAEAMYDGEKLAGFKFSVKVTNTGSCPGRQVVQIYCEPPQGKLGKPLRNLVSFAKTKELSSGESEELELLALCRELASYDDGGYTGNRACFVLEKGKYTFFLGDNVRDAESVYEHELDSDLVTERLQSACMPVESFDRLRYDENSKGFVKQSVPVRDYSIRERIEAERADIETWEKGLPGRDDAISKLLSSLTDDELICMTRMEGVYSPRSVDGTVGAFGGISDELSERGIPVACCSDGPSGIRRDDGSMAFSLPSGTLMACSFDTEMVEKLYEFEGMELRLNRIDALLGPGINIHRHPLNGRNFEYFSEDPLLTGQMAVAQLKGMAACNSTGTIKHFCANNQEKARTRIDSVVSERALREIYLKPFEIAIKEGDAYSVMTTYGALNGTYTAGNFDLVTTVLRHQWHYDGVVMTDWWAMVSDELYDSSLPEYTDIPEPKAERKQPAGAGCNESPQSRTGSPDHRSGASMKNAGPMIRAQNDLYSVHKVSAKNSGEDNIALWYEKGLITRAELLRSARNILRFIEKSSLPKTFMEGYQGTEAEITEKNRPYYDGKDKNRKIDEQLQSPPIGNV